MTNPAEEARRILTHSSSVLPYALGIALVKHVEELRRLRQADVETFMQREATMQGAVDRAELALKLEQQRVNRAEITAADRDRYHLAQIAALEARIRWQRRALIAAGVVWPVVVIALWSAYAS